MPFNVSVEACPHVDFGVKMDACSGLYIIIPYMLCCCSLGSLYYPISINPQMSLFEFYNPLQSVMFLPAIIIQCPLVCIWVLEYLSRMWSSMHLGLISVSKMGHIASLIVFSFLQM